ncbi:hypothetical protein PFISCL1PPCAC_9632, partial [Pristionchus fissidentatus]
YELRDTQVKELRREGTALHKTRSRTNVFPDLSRCCNVAVIRDNAYCFTGRLWALHLPTLNWEQLKVDGEQIPFCPSESLIRVVDSSIGLLEISAFSRFPTTLTVLYQLDDINRKPNLGVDPISRWAESRQEEFEDEESDE